MDPVPCYLYSNIYSTSKDFGCFMIKGDSSTKISPRVVITP